MAEGQHTARTLSRGHAQAGIGCPAVRAANARPATSLKVARSAVAIHYP